MALVNAYATVEEVRAQFSDSGDRLDIALLERAISSASRAVDKYCGRRFWADTVATARLYKTGCPDILDVNDISTQTDLVVETDSAGTGSWTVLDASDYHLEPLNADADGGSYAWWTVVVDDGSGFPVSCSPLVRVTAKWGWSSVPDEVVEATILKSVSLFRRKDAPFGVAGFGEFGVVRITRNDPDYADLLRPFRRLAVA